MTMDIDAIRARWPKDLPGAHPDVDQADEDITDLLAEVDALRADVERLKAQVEGLEEQLAEKRQRAAQHAREAKAWREDAEFWVQCERDTARWAACQPVAASTTLLLRSFAEPGSPEAQRREHAINEWLEDGAPNYRPGNEVWAELAVLPREDRLQAEVQRLREQERPRALEVDQLTAQVAEAAREAERLKASVIVRQPIETLPEEREGDVLVFLPGSAVGRGWGPQVKQISPTDEVWGSWTTWCPLPPLAPGLSGLEPGKEELEAQAQLADELLAELIAEEEAVANLRPMLVEGWEMPEAPTDGAVPRAAFSHDSKRWLLLWTTEDEWGLCSHGFIPWPFAEGVNVTADMLRVLGFTVEAGS